MSDNPDTQLDTATEAPVQPRPGEVSALRGLYDPSRDFRSLALEAQYFSKGFRLVDKDALIGVPHIIIGVTYRDGFLSPDKRIQGDYVSVEAVIADKDTLNSPQISSQLPVPADQLSVYPNESVVYNDGGTGIRRTFTELFHDIGLINHGGDPDRPMSQWAEGADRAAAGITADLNGQVFRYLALYGLRRSDYESPYGPATTFYIG